MRCVPALASLLLAACAGPATAGVHAHTRLTITEASDGSGGVPRAGPVNARICRWTDRDQGAHLTMRLGPSCVLDSDWTTRSVGTGTSSVPTGGSGAIASGQPCVLMLGETETALVVQGGSITQATEGGPIDATIDGLTPGEAPHQTSFRLAGSPYEHGRDAWCEHVAREEMEESASRP